MATKDLTLTLESRESVGTTKANALRHAGKIPGVLYGHGAAPQPVAGPLLLLAGARRERTAGTHASRGSDPMGRPDSDEWRTGEGDTPCDVAVVDNAYVVAPRVVAEAALLRENGAGPEIELGRDDDAAAETRPQYPDLSGWTRFAG